MRSARNAAALAGPARGRHIRASQIPCRTNAMPLARAALLLALTGLAPLAAAAQDLTLAPLGVPECDGFVERWNRCRLEKPANERMAMDGLIRQQHAAWAQLGPSRRPMLVQSCQQATQMWLDGNGCR